MLVSGIGDIEDCSTCTPTLPAGVVPLQEALEEITPWVVLHAVDELMVMVSLLPDEH